MGGRPLSSSATPSVSSPRCSRFGRRPMAATTWSTTTVALPLVTCMPPATSRSSALSPTLTMNSSFSRASSASLMAGSLRPATLLPVAKAITSTPSRASACAISTPSGPSPMTATRGPSVGCSNSVSVVRMRSPKASQSSGTMGREPVAMMMRRAVCTWPFTSTRCASSSRAWPLMARSPASVAASVPATKSSRSARTRRSTAGRSTRSASAPSMPKVCSARRAW